MTVWRPEPRCARPSWRCDKCNPPESPSQSRPRSPRPAKSRERRSMMSSAPSHRNLFLPSATGTRTSHRRPTRKSATCWRGDSILRRHKQTLEPADTTLLEAAHPLTGAGADYDPLMDLIGDARFVLLGEASHGTHEFYRERAQITKRLIEEKGFTAVAVEADWPDAYRVNRYVRNVSDDVDAQEALSDFRRFPRWMWRNTDVVEFVEWLRAHNDSLSQGVGKAGFYGLDLYSLPASMKAVIQYLERVAADAAKRARARYACFDHFGPDPQVYGFIAATDRNKSCRDEVVSQLVELRRRATEYARRDGRGAEDELFYAEQNARLVT